jgi:tetratricopeptide (TPR) repeat protein
MEHGSLSARPPASTRAVVVAVALCAFAMALKPVRSSDVWHHIKSGWFVVQNGGPATVDVFSCTARGKPWIQYEWLAQLCIYGLYQAGGAEELVLFQAGAVAILALMLMAAMRIQPRAGWSAAGLATALALCAASPRFFSRPETFSWILFAGWLIAVEKVRSGRGGYLALPAVLMAPWVNMHGAWPAGLAWLGLNCAGETALRLFGAPSRLPRTTVVRLWAALGLAAAATLANPYGFQIWEVPLKLTSWPEMSAVIVEWQRPDLAYWLDIRYIGAWIFLLAILAAPRRVRLSDALVVLAFGALVLSAKRHMALAMIAVAPIAAGQFSGLWEKWGRVKDERLGPVLPFFRSFPVLQPAAVALVCVALVIAALGGFDLKRAGLGVDHSISLEGAAHFLKDNKLDGNLFNSYEAGNYLLFARYPQNHVFIDGRVDVYGAEGLSLYTAVRHAEKGWQKIFEEHSIETCVLATKMSSEFLLLSALHRSPDWALVYWDDLSAIYVKRAPDRQAFLSRAYVYAVRPDHFDPAVLESLERLARAERDYRAKLREDPNFAGAAYSLARCLLIQRDQRDEAVELLERAVALDPENAIFCATLGATLLQMGKPGEAERRLRDALEDYRRAPDSAPTLSVIYWNLSLLCEQKGDLEGALAAAQKASRLRPEMTAAADRVRALEQKLAERRRGP